LDQIGLKSKVVAKNSQQAFTALTYGLQVSYEAGPIMLFGAGFGSCPDKCCARTHWLGMHTDYLKHI